MRISDSQPAPDDPSVSDNSDSRQKTDSDSSSAFSKMLAKKKDADKNADSLQGASQTGAKGRQGDVDQSAIGLMQAEPLQLDRSIQPSAVDSKHMVAVPPELQQVVREISTAVNAAGNHEVQIELNSNVLKGLHIRIEKQDSGVSIQFQSNSDQVSTLLSKNVDSLMQGLGDRGVTVSNINISGPRETARSQDGKNRWYPSGGQGGRQDRGR
jgi:hypothetical protein